MKNTGLIIAAGILIGLAAVTAFIGQPTPDELVVRSAPQLEEMAAGRKYYIDPAELLELVHDPEVELIMLDLRSENEYNLFHIADARRMALAELDRGYVADWHERSVKVVMATGEATADDAWRRLKAMDVPNCYILAGGVAYWLSVYGPEGDLNLRPFDPESAGDVHAYKYPYDLALGSRHPASRPGEDMVVKRKYDKKVEIVEVGPRVKGGCGG